MRTCINPFQQIVILLCLFLLESCENSIPLQSQPQQVSKPLQRAENEDQTTFLQESMQGYTQRIAGLEEKKEESQSRFDALTKEKAELDTDEDILYWSKAFTLEKYLRKHTSKYYFIYNGIPFDKVEELKYLETIFDRTYVIPCFNSISIEPEAGKYRAYYYEMFTRGELYDLLEEQYQVDPTFKIAEVKIYIKKRNYPNIKTRIKQIKKGLKEYQAAIEECNRVIEEVQPCCENTEALLKHYTENR